MGTATLIEPLPHLPIDEVSTKRFAVTLNLRQIVRWFGHRLPGKHRTVANVITCEVEGFVERVFQAGGGASGGEFLAQRAGLRACTHAASAPVRAITSHAFSRVLWSNRSMEQVRQLLREALGALEKALSPQGVQVLKFGLLFAVLVAIDCWLTANQHAVFIESGKNVGPLREITWFGLVLLDISGVLNVLGYAVIANRKLFTTLRLPSIIVLTVLTAVASIGPVVQGRILYYLHDGRIVYLAYPIIVSVVTVLTRYFWFRRKGQLGAAEG